MDRRDSKDYFAAAQFRTTRWSLVMEAGHTVEGRKALELLCDTYWYPLYAFIRRRNTPPEEAQDLVQGFFARLIESRAIKAADPDEGKFRTYLLGALKNFMVNEWRDAHRLKRGGGYQIVSWEGMDPEERYTLEPADDASAEDLFDRRWAQTVVNETLARVRGEMEAEGMLERYEVLKGFLEATDAPSTYEDAAQRLGLSEPAVKSAIHRLRRRYAQLVREEVAATVNSPAEVDDEIRRLIELLSKN